MARATFEECRHFNFFPVDLTPKSQTPLCHVRRSSAFSPPRLAYCSDGLSWSYAYSRPRGRCRSLNDASGRPYTNGDVRITSALLALNDNESVAQVSHGQTSILPSIVVVFEGDRAATSIGPPHRPVLTQVSYEVT